MLEPISTINAAEVSAFLARRPYETVVLQWLTRVRSLSHPGRNLCFLSRNDGGAVDGVCYFGTQFMPAAQSDSALQAFAQIARNMPLEHMIVGPRAQIERWWEFLRPWHRTPRAIRARQPMYALSRANLRGSRTEAKIGLATLQELDEIACESARMIAHETGIAPNPRNPEFRERTARIIRAGWWWRWRSNGVLRFQCNIGAKASQTAQIQGVWTPPAQRRNGYATRALGAICDRLLDDIPTLSLYVNDFNTQAIALYEHVGFQQVGEFSTLLF